MKRAWMASTGKHFPGHGSVKADSHVAAAIDHRSYEEIYQKDMQSFIQLQPQLDALMPAHVIYENIGPNPAGFSPYWIQKVLRQELQFDGILFSDDLSMQAACVAGGADARIQAALNAGCDMGLVCNNRESACIALDGIQNLALPNQERLERMRGKIPQIEIGQSIELGADWQNVRNRIVDFKNQYC